MAKKTKASEGQAQRSTHHIKRPARPIRILGARQNNLKNIDIEFPHRKLSVITGLSGSGKSSLAFDTLYAEGQRRYIESLSTYTRQFLEKMPKPDVDKVENIPPSIALEQRNYVLNSRSTVGTQTEIVDYLRILFAKAGSTYCLKCQNLVKKIDAEVVLQEALTWLSGKKGAVAAPIRLSENQAAEASPKSRKKNTKKKVNSHAPSARSWFQVLREQGFRRVLWQASAQRREILDLENLDSDPVFNEITALSLAEQELWIVVDRFKGDGKNNEKNHKDLRSRLYDSIQQAIQIGKGKVALLDLDAKNNKADRHFDCRFSCSKCGTEHRIPEPNLFSFNSPLGACDHCSGFGFTLDLDESKVVPDPSRTLLDGAIDPLAKPSTQDYQKAMWKFAESHGISTGKRYRELNQKQRQLLWKGDGQSQVFPGIEGIFNILARSKYKLHMRVFIRRYQSQLLCTQCHGNRLKPEALAVKINHYHISDILNLSVSEALQWAEQQRLTGEAAKIAHDVLEQVQRRLHFLNAVGVGYLTLSRLAKTLSGGEFQRINLATQLGNGLCGTLYVLDEPSIGLHAADTERLISVLENLRDQGNTVIVVEHDLAVMRKADFLLELGPGSGKRGGEILAAGDAKKVQETAGSLTGKYLSGAFKLESPRAIRPPATRSLRLTGCSEHNLKKINISFPLERFVVVTGVSGSGKTTLVHRTLFQALDQVFAQSHSDYGRLALGQKPKESDDFGRFDKMYGAEHLSGVVLLDQKPIGKSSRSNPATYVKAWDEVRRIYANQVLSLRRGYTPQHFSFNVDGGRCPVCKGEGEITLDMHFMADVSLPCDECHGKRFKKNILDIFYKNKNVHQILNTSIDETYDIFRDNAVLSRKLGILRDVGLGYLQLGQSATTLSGGESQRLKIAAALENSDARDRSRHLYIFDEPTTGLHHEDIRKLMRVVHDLVDSHNSVIMIEHHLDVIAQADWVIDLGPGGGSRGGELVAEGSPESLTRQTQSITGQMLKQEGYRFPDNPVTLARELSLNSH